MFPIKNNYSSWVTWISEWVQILTPGLLALVIQELEEWMRIGSSFSGSAVLMACALQTHILDQKHSIESLGGTQGLNIGIGWT